jgi:hypothetical protein
VSKKLQLADALSLPIDAVTQTFAFLGRRGSGKTYGATKLAELMLDAGAQIAVLDPVGVWYGLRLAADGKTPGIEIPVFGGLHGDLPLESTAGALIADVLVDRGISAVIDVSQMISSEQARFATAFATRLFDRRKSAPAAMHLFIEECQEFIPQNPMEGEKHMLHAFQRLVKLGRNFGIGISQISQRPQEVAKKVLNMSEVLLAFQMTGPQERKAISAYVDERGADDDVIDVLPKLQVGHAHVWSPQWLQVSETVHIAQKRTFDASSTPKVGAKATEARPLAPIDLEKLRTAMAATIEKAKADDPKLLRAEIARLKRDLEGGAKKNGHAIPKPVIDQAAIDKAVARAIATDRKRLRPALERLQRLVTPLLSIPDAVGALAQIVNESATPGALLAPTEHRLNPPSPVASLSGSKPEGRSGGHARRDSRERPATLPADGTLSRSQQRILDALAAFEQLGISPAKRVNVAFVAGYTENGHFNNMVGELRTNGYLDYPGGGTVQLTDAGRAIANAAANEIQTLEDLHNTWLRKLSPSEGKLLTVLIDRYPDPITRAELAEQTGYTENGHFNNMVGHLRTLGAADYPGGGQVVATDVLFPEGLV